MLFSRPALAQTTTPVATSSATIIISEYMPDASPEWVEIQNTTNSNISIIGWKLGDSTSNTKTIPSTTIPANGFYSFDISGSFLNNDSDMVRLFDPTNTLIDSTNYLQSSPNYSWSKVSGTWCLANSSNGSINNSCFVPSPTPTNTPLPTSTPHPTNTPNPTNTPSPTFIPTLTPTPTISLTPTLTPSPTPTVSIIQETPVIEPTSVLNADDSSSNQSDVLGASDLISPVLVPTKTTTNLISPSLISGIFIVAGGLLLITPLIILKLKK